MENILTHKEIFENFISEWVLVEDPVTDDSFEVLSGKVLCHSKDRDEVYRKAIELKPRRIAFLYTGDMPKHTAIIL